jgi:RNA polymerase sigma-70 factor, ECF subfamily
MVGGLGVSRTATLPPQDSDLVARAQAGDQAAFEQLYKLHVSRVFALCMRMAGNADRAEELTQDVFVRTWEKLGSFRGDSAFSTWLHRVAVNLVLSRGRATTRRASREVTTDDVAAFERPGPSKPRAGAGLDLEAAIATLPEGARKVFVLHDVEGYKHGEIADMMGLATGTCKAQLHRARRMLREVLER